MSDNLEKVGIVLGRTDEVDSCGDKQEDVDRAKCINGMPFGSFGVEDEYDLSLKAKGSAHCRD